MQTGKYSYEAVNIAELLSFNTLSYYYLWIFQVTLITHFHKLFVTSNFFKIEEISGNKKKLQSSTSLTQII